MRVIFFGWMNIPSGWYLMDPPGDPDSLRATGSGCYLCPGAALPTGDIPENAGTV